MKSYYHAHESAYQQIKSKGYVGWGNAKTVEELGDEKTNAYLKKIISQNFSSPKGKSALDVGCGTGTTAFTLAKLGFEVTGSDISETAIEMGKELALQQGLKIKFLVSDIIQTEYSLEKFDLIYDSHCLHCIVFEEDRNAALSNIKKSLKADGIFILDTMVLPEEKIDMAKGYDSLRFDENYILWHETKTTEGRGIVEIEGQNWCAQRRVYPPEIVMGEVKNAGFEVISHQLDAQPSEPSMLRLVLK